MSGYSLLQRTMTMQAVNGAQLVGRIADLLRSLATGIPLGLRATDVAQVTGLTEPTARRILKALAAESLVVQDSRTRRYRLGPLAFELGLATNYQSSLTEQARPIIRRLAAETGDTVCLLMRSGTDVVCIGRAEGHFPIRASIAELGERRPLGVGSSGVVLLAGLDDSVISHFADTLNDKVAAYEQTTISEIRDRINAARALGYSDLSGMPLAGVRGISVAVPSSVGPPTFAVTLVAVEERFTPDHHSKVLALTKDAAMELSAATMASETL